MAILEVYNLTKRFGDFTAVNDVSFDLEQGHILGMLGPNGAGKTTTLQMLLGVLTPTSGGVAYFGKSFLKHRQEIAERINFSSTYINLPWILKVKECLEVMSLLYEIKDRAARIREVIIDFQLEELLEQTVDSLSAGQNTRLCLAKAMLNRPEVLLLDEPTASLDPDIAVNIRNFLLDYRRNHNISIIITSHNMAEVELMCDEVLFINQGTIISKGTPESLARQVRMSRLSLVVPNKGNELAKFCDQQGLNFTRQGDRVTIEITEQAIAKLLGEIHQRSIYYIEINIDQPNLEDYFLSIANKTHEL